MTKKYAFTLNQISLTGNEVAAIGEEKLRAIQAEKEEGRKAPKKAMTVKGIVTASFLTTLGVSIYGLTTLDEDGSMIIGAATTALITGVGALINGVQTMASYSQQNNLKKDNERLEHAINYRGSNARNLPLTHLPMDQKMLEAVGEERVTALRDQKIQTYKAQDILANSLTGNFIRAGLVMAGVGVADYLDQPLPMDMKYVLMTAVGFTANAAISAAKTADTANKTLKDAEFLDNAAALLKGGDKTAAEGRVLNHHGMALPHYW